MARLLEITEGWGELLTFYVEKKVAGVWTAVNLTDYTINLGLMRDATNTLLTGTITKLNQTTLTGYFTYLPVSSDFDVAAGLQFEVQKAHVILTASSRDVTAPHGAAADILVHRRVPSA